MSNSVEGAQVAKALTGCHEQDKGIPPEDLKICSSVDVPLFIYKCVI